MPTPAESKLAEYGISIADAHGYVLSHLDQLGAILDIARDHGITNAMLGEIANWPQDPYPASTVISYFSNHGLDSSVLDTPPVTGRVASVGNPAATEGAELVYLVQLSSPTAGHTDLPTTVAFGTASPADIGQVYATNGVIFAEGSMHILDAGVSNFEVHIKTVDDSAAEPSETVLLTVDGVTGSGSIDDNDSKYAALVGVPDAA